MRHMCKRLHGSAGPYRFQSASIVQPLPYLVIVLKVALTVFVVI